MTFSALRCGSVVVGDTGPRASPNCSSSKAPNARRAQAPIGIWTTDSADRAGIHEVPLSAAAGSDWQVTQAPPRQGAYLQSAVARVFPLADASLAHTELEAGRVTRGRVVFAIAPESAPV